MLECRVNNNYRITLCDGISHKKLLLQHNLQTLLNYIRLLVSSAIYTVYFTACVNKNCTCIHKQIRINYIHPIHLNVSNAKAKSKKCYFEASQHKIILKYHSCYTQCKEYMMTSSNGNIFSLTGPLWGESTCHRWIRFTKASNLWTKSFQIISVTCLNITMRFMTLEPEVMIGFTYTQPAQAVLVTSWYIIYRNY